MSKNQSGQNYSQSGGGGQKNRRRGGRGRSSGRRRYGASGRSGGNDLGSGRGGHDQRGNDALDDSRGYDYYHNAGSTPHSNASFEATGESWDRYKEHNTQETKEWVHNRDSSKASAEIRSEDKRGFPKFRDRQNNHIDPYYRPSAHHSGGEGNSRYRWWANESDRNVNEAHVPQPQPLINSTSLENTAQNIVMSPSKPTPTIKTEQPPKPNSVVAASTPASTSLNQSRWPAETIPSLMEIKMEKPEQIKPIKSQRPSSSSSSSEEEVTKTVAKTANTTILNKPNSKPQTSSSSSSSSDEDEVVTKTTAKPANTTTLNKQKSKPETSSSSSSSSDEDQVTRTAAKSIKITSTKSKSNNVDRCIKDTASSPNATKSSNKDKKAKSLDRDVICLGNLEKSYVVEDDDDDEVENEQKQKKERAKRKKTDESSDKCLLCDKKCQMICKNCSAPYHNLRSCPRPPNVSIMLQYFMEFCMQQLNSFNPDKIFESPLGTGASASGVTTFYSSKHTHTLGSKSTMASMANKNKRNKRKGRQHKEETDESEDSSTTQSDSNTSEDEEISMTKPKKKRARKSVANDSGPYASHVGVSPFASMPGFGVHPSIAAAYNPLMFGLPHFPHAQGTLMNDFLAKRGT